MNEHVDDIDILPGYIRETNLDDNVLPSTDSPPPYDNPPPAYIPPNIQQNEHNSRTDCPICPCACCCLCTIAIFIVFFLIITHVIKVI